MEIEILIMSFKTDRFLKTESEKIRAFFASKFKEHILLHHHNIDGGFLYKYPRIQYKIMKNRPTLIAFGAGCEVIGNIFNKCSKIQIENHIYEIVEKTIIVKKDNFGLSQKQKFYVFLSPWLALNEENYERYKAIKKIKDKMEILNRVLIGNIISISKSLGYTVPASIEANIKKIKEVKTNLKGVPMIGFLGNFSVNFEIPNYFGIGKSVSRGFGTIVKDNLNRSSGSNRSNR